MRTRGEVIVVTGASAGVGRAIAHAFARPVAKIALIARGRPGLEECRREVEERGGKAMVCPLDVADSAAVFRAAREIEAQWGTIDIWVNNAMVSVFSPVKEMSAEEFQRVTNVTYLGVVHGTLAALKVMLPRDHGRILQIGSALAYRSIPLQSAYCAAKHAVLGFTSSLRSELIHDGSRVTVTIFELPAVNTPQFRWVRSRLPRKPQPVPPIFQPEMIAEAVVWAARSGRRELVIAWPAQKAIWANKWIPSLADRYLAYTNYDAQQTEEPAPPGRPDNLYHPLPALASTHGDFDGRSLRTSKFFWLTKNGKKIAAAAALLYWGIRAYRRREESRPESPSKRAA